MTLLMAAPFDGRRCDAMSSGGAEMNARSEEFQRRAAACEENARRGTFPRHTEDYRRMAQRWREMAEQAEHEDDL